MLHSLGRYLGQLQGLENDKQELNADQELIVSVIAGVEGNAPDASVTYADAADPQFQLDYGIGPPSLHSVCADNYDAALADLGERIADQIQPSCYTKCVGDTDLSTPQLEPGCTLEQDPPGNDNTERLDPCPRDAQGHYLIDAETGTFELPAGEDVCFVMRVDPDGTQTTDPNDDMSEICVAQNFNLEFEVVRREGVPALGGTSVSVTCELACFPEVTCLGIGG